MHLLEKYPEKIQWFIFSTNPAAIHIIEKYKRDNIHDSLHYGMLSYEIYKNPGIFTYDYVAMKESYRALKEEIVMAAWHPNRLTNILEQGLDPDDL